MRLEELQAWLLEDGLTLDLDRLIRLSAAKELPRLERDQDLIAPDLDWQRLLLAGSFLARANTRAAQEAALRIANGAMLLSDADPVRDSAAILLGQLANHRGVELAERRAALRPQVEERLGVAGRILSTRRRLEHAVTLQTGEALPANRFQRAFWEATESADWLSVSAPTAAGKTYIVLRWLLDRIAAGAASSVVYLAPTRALVTEIEIELRAMASRQGLANLNVSALPMAPHGAEAGHGQRAVLVLTQERLHLLANSTRDRLAVDLLVVDEAHKVGDHLRGVILQDAVERLVRSNPRLRVVFLSPATQNPGVLLEDAPPGATASPVDSDAPTVSQNLIEVSQAPGDTRLWAVGLRQSGRRLPLGMLRLTNRPDGVMKRVALLTAAIGDAQGGTLVYANGAADAEKIAWLIADAVCPERTDQADEELEALADLARHSVHPEYLLASLAPRGVGFHYGNMPSLLRTEIERLFREGKLRVLVCTSTLIEGVNLACRTIVLRGPRKGRGKPMEPHDFWNLAGRAGRWGHEFQGNIVCIDPANREAWPNGLPARTRFPIRRETDEVLQRGDDLIAFLDARWEAEGRDLTSSKAAELEQVGAYLLATWMRERSVTAAPWARRFDGRMLAALDRSLAALAARIEIPAALVARHPGVSAVGMQKLLEYFRERTARVQEMLLAPPESDDAHSRITRAFTRIHRCVFPAFGIGRQAGLQALVTLEWLRGMPLPRIIRKRLERRARDRDPEIPADDLPQVIRETMQLVEEVARFRAPRYLSCYLDVLDLHLEQIGRADLRRDDLRFDLYLEFGVATTTLLSLVGLGLSRTSAVALSGLIARDDLSPDGCIDWVVRNRADLRRTDLPAAIRREIEQRLRSPVETGGNE